MSRIANIAGKIGTTSPASETPTVWVAGEPSATVGGGMPNVAVEIRVDRDLCRASMRVLIANSAILPLVNYSDGRGPVSAKAGTDFPVDYANGDPLAILLAATMRTAWRKVTSATPFWDGQNQVAPASE